MLGPPLTGRTLIWHPVSDPPGGWAYSLDDELVADVVRSGDEQAYRIEVADEVWRVAFSRGPLLRGVLRTPGDSVRLVCAGSLGRGLIRMREGGGFTWYSQVSLREGPWSAELRDCLHVGARPQAGPRRPHHVSHALTGVVGPAAIPGSGLTAVREGGGRRRLATTTLPEDSPAGTCRTEGSG